MAEREYDFLSDAASQVRADIESLIDGFNVQAVMDRVQEYGKVNPVGLALTALTVGVAAGVLMRNKPFLSS